MTVLNNFLIFLALILEEIGLDTHDLAIQNKLFAEAQELHTYVLQFSLLNYGTINMYTAKCHGNLGRLLQSMKKYKVSFLTFIKYEPIYLQIIFLIFVIVFFTRSRSISLLFR